MKTPTKKNITQATTLVVVFIMSSVLLLYAGTLEVAHAGGSGSAQSELLLINDAYHAVEIKTTPAILSKEGGDTVTLAISMKNVDAADSAPISGVMYNLRFADSPGSAASLADFDAYSPDEELTIQITPDKGAFDVSGTPFEDGAWLATGASPLALKAPVFLNAGIVYVYVTALSIESQPISADDSTFEIAFSMGEYIPFTFDADGTTHEIVFATYFDEIDKFEYDKQARSVSAEMPFTWTAEYIQDASFIHAEYFIPKTVKLFDDHEILLAVNGMDYFGTVDRSGQDEIVIHYLLSAPKLHELLETLGPDYADKLVFEMRAGEMRQKSLDASASLESGDVVVISSTGSHMAYTLHLAAEPAGMIHPENEIELSLEIRDADSDQLVPDAVYDFEIIFGDDIILEETGRNAPRGTDTIITTFENTGIATFRISNIAGSDAGGKFTFVVSEPHAMPGHGGGGDGSMTHGMGNDSMKMDMDAMSAMQDAMDAMMSAHGIMMQEHNIMMQEHGAMMNDLGTFMDVEMHEFMMEQHAQIVAEHNDTVQRHMEMANEHEQSMTGHAASMSDGMAPMHEEMQRQHQIMAEDRDLMAADHATLLADHDTMRKEHEKMTAGDDAPIGGGCLIATAAFGSELAPQVQQLRDLRDNTVLNTASGTAFMSGFNQFYYAFSPAVADLERENSAFRDAVRTALTPMLLSLSLLSHAGIDTESEMLGYGVSVILLNLGMYVGAPALATVWCARAVQARFTKTRSF